MKTITPLTREEKARYEQFLEDAPKSPEPLHPNLFDISGYPHYEKVLSNWYAFFLDAEQPHGFGDLFLRTLERLINEKLRGPEVTFNFTWKVETEVFTNGGGKIDLLITEKSEMPSTHFYENALIIENKVYHELKENDLGDYYDSIDSKNKIGVVIGLCEYTSAELEASNASKNTYISVTHHKFKSLLEKEEAVYLHNIEGRYQRYFKDLMANIHKLTPNKHNMEAIEFYFHNGQMIDKMLKFRDNAFAFFEATIREATRELEWNYKTSNHESATLEHDDGWILYVGCGKLFASSHQKSWLSLWINNSQYAEKWNHLPFKGRSTHLDKWIQNGFTLAPEVKDKTKSFVKIGQMDLPIANFEALRDIGTTVQKHLNEVINPIVEKLRCHWH